MRNYLKYILIAGFLINIANFSNAQIFGSHGKLGIYYGGYFLNNRLTDEFKVTADRTYGGYPGDVDTIRKTKIGGRMFFDIDYMRNYLISPTIYAAVGIGFRKYFNENYKSFIEYDSDFSLGEFYVSDYLSPLQYYETTGNVVTFHLPKNAITLPMEFGYSIMSNFKQLNKDKKNMQGIIYLKLIPCFYVSSATITKSANGMNYSRNLDYKRTQLYTDLGFGMFSRNGFGIQYGLSFKWSKHFKKNSSIPYIFTRYGPYTIKLDENRFNIGLKLSFFYNF